MSTHNMFLWIYRKYINNFWLIYVGVQRGPLFRRGLLKTNFDRVASLKVYPLNCPTILVKYDYINLSPAEPGYIMPLKQCRSRSVGF